MDVNRRKNLSLELNSDEFTSGLDCQPIKKKLIFSKA